jgi:dihydroorotate dehydrogenase (NAD+) catalytic subunit
MLNAIGLANVGAEAFARDIAPRAASARTVVIGSIAGFSVEGYAQCARMFQGAEGIGAVELNVSCPNVHSGTQFGDDPRLLADLVTAVRRELTKKLLVKLPPVVSGPPGFTIVDLARAAVDAGGDGLVIANTIPAMAIDVESRRPRLANVTGGLSGPAVHLAAVRLVHLVHRALPGVAIVGAGGVMTWEDAAEFVLAGATAVEMGTALFADPRAPERVVRGLESWVGRQGKSSIRDLVGAVELSGGGRA